MKNYWLKQSFLKEVAACMMVSFKGRPFSSTTLLVDDIVKFCKKCGVKASEFRLEVSGDLPKADYFLVGCEVL